MTIRDNTSKKKLVRNILEITGIPASLSRRLVNDAIKILISNIVKNKNIKIKNFGTINLQKKKNRMGRNPKNKIKYEIFARNVLTFKPSDPLKRKINNDHKK